MPDEKEKKLKILNLYAGIGGNRKLWKDVEDYEEFEDEDMEESDGLILSIGKDGKALTHKPEDYVEREFIELDTEIMWKMKNVLGIKKNKCYYCDAIIKPEDKFSIFNKPTRLICHSILCVTEAISEDD